MKKIAVLIPAHNEGVVIDQTLLRLCKILSSKDLYVVDDGSIDNTCKISRKYTKNVLHLKSNKGKAKALNTAIEYFRLFDKYKYLMPMDADSILSKSFIKQTTQILDSDYKHEAACVVGRVMSRKSGRISAYRIWEYEVAQSVHKNAQSIIGAMAVCPGPSTVYRSGLFKKTKIPEGTMTEDMDLTFQIHRQRLGKILFSNSPTVYTQDPKTIKDFIKQLDRWYTGFWQCVMKHGIPWGGQMLDLEVSVLAMEGLFGGLITIMFLFAIPFALSIQPAVLIAPLAFDFGIFVFPTMLFAALKNHSIYIFRHTLYFYLLRIVSSVVFLKSFMKVVLSIDLSMKFWDRVKRYSYN